MLGRERACSTHRAGRMSPALWTWAYRPAPLTAATTRKGGRGWRFGRSKSVAGFGPPRLCRKPCSELTRAAPEPPTGWSDWRTSGNRPVLACRWGFASFPPAPGRGRRTGSSTFEGARISRRSSGTAPLPLAPGCWTGKFYTDWGG